MTTLAPVRLSTVRDCPRRAVFAATGQPERPVTEKEQRILWSGKRIGQDYLDMLEAGGTGPIEREVKIPWDFGVGHADGWIPETGTIIEILSSAHASEQMVRSKLLQLTLYMHFLEESRNGVLLIVNPRDYGEERVIVAKNDDDGRYAGLLAEALARVEEVRAWNETGVLPDRVCRKPAEAISHFCRHAEHCFTGWAPAPLPSLDTAEAREAALAFAQAKTVEREAAGVLAAAKEQREQAQTALARLDLPAGETQVGPFVVKRIHYKGRKTFKLPLAEEDSRIPRELLAEFTTVGDPYDVWKIDRVASGDALTADSFGEEVPF